MSVPMTSSDLERRRAVGQNFPADLYIITLVQFDLSMTEFSMLTICDVM